MTVSSNILHTFISVVKYKIAVIAKSGIDKRRDIYNIILNTAGVYILPNCAKNNCADRRAKQHMQDTYKF